MTVQSAMVDRQPLFDRKSPLPELAGEGNRLWKIASRALECDSDFARLDTWWRNEGSDLDHYLMHAAGTGTDPARMQARDWAQRISVAACFTAFAGVKAFGAAHELGFISTTQCPHTVAFSAGTTGLVGRLAKSCLEFGRRP